MSDDLPNNFLFSSRVPLRRKTAQGEKGALQELSSVHPVEFLYFEAPEPRSSKELWLLGLTPTLTFISK
ncbi:MAG: hypothetical protein QNJ41_08250 [Xenococcaceae cyanobacterium MO_188.B32]|nr:hypothetical protein [Xenococcaceae cyanobacterium MO_188.B32]